MEIHIALEESVRMQIAQNIRLILADTYILYAKTQNFLWNLKDFRFYALHLLLKKQCKELFMAIDKYAQRIRILGERTPGGLKQLVEMSSLSETEEDLNADEMLQELLSNHETLCHYLRQFIERSIKFGDEGTSDLLIKQLRMHEENAWLLRSSLEE